MQFSRRKFLAATGTGLALAPLPAWAQGHGMSHGGHGGSHRMPKGPLIPAGFGVLTGQEIELTVGDGLREVAGRRGLGVAVNGTVPGPLLRLKEGDEVTPARHQPPA